MDAKLFGKVVADMCSHIAHILVNAVCHYLDDALIYLSQVMWPNVGYYKLAYCRSSCRPVGLSYDKY